MRSYGRRASSHTTTPGSRPGHFVVSSKGTITVDRGRLYPDPVIIQMGRETLAR